MTTISAQIIKDSISPEGIRLTTMELRYPRWIHAEMRTHRAFRIGEELDLPTPSVMQDENLSRNAASSRAIPVARLIQDVLVDPAIPLFWGKNQRGMQADEEHKGDVPIWSSLASHLMSQPRDRAWLLARDQAVQAAHAFAKAGYHKQIVNRLLEPFSHINVLVTATDWNNFFHLRDHKDAEPHIRLLAQEMKKAMEGSTPELLEPGEWHLPYVSDTDWDSILLSSPFGMGEALDLARKISVARCASVSYKTVDDQPMTVERAVALYDKLVGSDPLHASPCEHQATPDTKDWRVFNGGREREWNQPKQHGNFRGWRQFRKMLANEFVPG